MRSVLCLLVCVMTASIQVDDLQPPDNPYSVEIKHSIRDDVAKGRDEVALAKHIWFHDNSFRLQPSLTGVLDAKFIDPEKNISEIISNYHQNRPMSKCFGDSHTK